MALLAALAGACGDPDPTGIDPVDDASVTPTDAGDPDAGDPDAGAPDAGIERADWTAGHGDIAFRYSDPTGLAALLNLDDATVDGVAGTSGEFDIGGVEIRSAARYARPTPDGGAFEPLCVGPGEEVWWLPQNNLDAAKHGAPFLGIDAAIDFGVFASDQLVLELVGIESPSGSGTYALWRDGFPPQFSFSSCDGIDASDTMTLPIGHDHYNMAFSEPGNWRISYRVSGELASDGTVLSTALTVNYVLE